MNDDSLDEMIKRKIGELDHIYPPHLPPHNVLWHSLSELRKHRKTQKNRMIWWKSAAAAVIVLIACYAFLVAEKPGSTLNADGPTQLTWSEKEQHALDFIEKFCATKNVSCQGLVIQDLRSDLEQSSRKLKKIDQQLHIYRNDAELIRARTRIERHQARVIKTIIQTL